MPSFRFQAVAATGEFVTGEMEAATQDEIVARLQLLGHVPLRAEAGVPLSRARAALWRKRKRRHGPRALARMAQQLALLIQAGLSVDRALEIAAMTSESEAEAADLESLLDDVRGGRSLADAMAANPEAFPRSYVGMIRAGEAGATLDSTLRDLAALLERAQAAREQVKSALIYPAVVLATCFGSIVMLFLFVIPRFRPIFSQAGATLSFTASAVLAVSQFTEDYWWAMLAAVALTVLATMHGLRRPAGRAWCDRRLLALPLAGDIVAKLEIGRFANTLGVLLRNGVSPLAALAIARDAVGNTAIADALATVAQSLQEGKGLAEPIAQSGVFPLLAVQLIRVGEETAHLETMLVKIGELFEQETRRSIERLLALLVPAITILLGIVVAVAIGSIFTAILGVYEFAL